MSTDPYIPQSSNNEDPTLEHAVPKLNVFKGVGDIISSPKALFDVLPGNGSSFWMPYLLLTVFGLVFFIWYGTSIDMYEFFNNSMAQQGENLADDMPADQIGIVLTITKYSLMATPIFLLIPLLIYSSVLLVFSNIVSSKRITFGTWFAFSLWTSIPLIFSYMVKIMMFYKLGAGDSFVSLSNLDILSINSLITHFDSTHALSELFSQLDVFYFWSLGLAVYGFHKITETKIITAAVITILPVMVLPAIQIVMYIVNQ